MQKKLILKDLKIWLPAILLFIVYHEVAIHLWKASCPMILLTGLPCPGCGMTRAVFLALTFQFQKAFYLNPVAFIWIPFVIYFLCSRYLGFYNKKLIYRLLIIVLLLTFIRYFYGMINYFPNRIPYVYSHNNLLYAILSRKN